MTPAQLEVLGKTIYCRTWNHRKAEFFGEDGYSPEGMAMYNMVYPEEVQRFLKEIQDRIDNEIEPDLKWDSKIDDEPDERRAAQLRVLKSASHIKW